jgi:hypothetical protein
MSTSGTTGAPGPGNGGQGRWPSPLNERRERRIREQAEGDVLLRMLAVVFVVAVALPLLIVGLAQLFGHP